MEIKSLDTDQRREIIAGYAFAKRLLRHKWLLLNYRTLLALASLLESKRTLRDLGAAIYARQLADMKRSDATCKTRLN